MTTKNKNRNIFYLFIGISLSLIHMSCGKDWLEVKPSRNDVIPSKLAEFQALLDNDGIMNREGTFAGELSSDDYYVFDNTWQTQQNLYVKNAYIWAKDITGGVEYPLINSAWSAPYRIVFYSNIALEGLEKIDPTPATLEQWNQVKGSALFYRSFAYNLLVQNYAPVYTEATATNALGIPLRLTSAIEETMVRTSLKESYETIIRDLKQAAALLPNVTNNARTRPSKAAAFALLSRVYLSMSDFSNALQMADSSITYNNTIYDYNKITSTATFPIARFNPEMLFYFLMPAVNFTSYPQRKVDSVLYSTYQTNDLRLKVFFSKQPEGIRYNGSYDGTATYFIGLANDEVYLTRAECHARLGSLGKALKDLNELLKNRWKTGTFVPVDLPNVDQALERILLERRKQLLCRGIRWTDLKRLNLEQKFAKTLKRVIAGTTYLLPPNDPRYVFAIPEKVVQYNGIQQNER